MKKMKKLRDKIFKKRRHTVKQFSIRGLNIVETGPWITVVDGGNILFIECFDTYRMKDDIAEVLK